jgi:diguanylate cyclase (GGDEF)-like protein
MTEKKEVSLYILIIGIAAMAVAIFIGSLILDKIIKSIGIIVNTLDTKAHKDMLTGVLNKGSFEERVTVALSDENTKRKCAVILLDVDNFKSVNDTLGHAYGDKVLADIGDVLRKLFGEKNIIGRLGGDEFCVFLTVPDFYRINHIKYVENKCAELCREFNSKYTGDDNGYKISVSVGAAIFPDHGTAFQKLYRCADNALYVSKRSGKDTYTIFDK